jgi:hypothetical protein
VFHATNPVIACDAEYVLTLTKDVGNDRPCSWP